MPLLLSLADIPALAVLGVYLALIATAAFAGGSSVAFLALTHRQMQVALSLTGGVLLGVGLLHLLPHAWLQLDRDLETTMGWVLLGFFLMFLLERAFHGHAHHTADGGPDGHSHAHHDGCHHSGHAHHQPPGPLGRWAWCGAFAGLATFLAILLHKPFDAGIIATLMIGGRTTGRTRTFVNLCYALMVPCGAAAFLASLRLFGGQQDAILGVALAMAAGAFLCIAAADLLPEVQFHSHDRVLLTASLALGLTIAWGITVLERSSHAHSMHGAAAPANVNDRRP
jgi:zinc and cadmium transporter